MQQNMNLSMAPYTQAGAFVCSQYDVGRTCQIKLTDDSGDYAIPTGAMVTVMATKPSGLGFAVACTWSGSTVTLVTTETMTNEFGRFPAEIRVTSGDTVLGTTNFYFKVERSPHQEGTVDGDAETIINQITLLVNRAEAAADAAVEDAQATIDEILDTIPQDIADLKADIGDLSELETEDKSSLVDAINEAVNSADAEAVNALIEAYITEHHIEGVTDEEIQEMVDTYLEGGSVEDAVNAWLVAHPEATTTVQDGSITMAKLATEVKEKMSETDLTYKWNAVGYMRTHVREFQGWAQCVVFEPDLNCAVGIVTSGNASHSYIEPWYRVTIDNSGYMSAYEKITVYDTDGVTEYTPTGWYMGSLCRMENGTYICIGNDHNIYTSNDYCETLTRMQTYAFANSGSMFGLKQLSNGRLIVGFGGNYNGFYYSDDGGETWTNVTPNNNGLGQALYPEGYYKPFEPCFIDCGNGRVIAYARKSNGAYTTASTPYTQQEPAVYSVSTDYGATWTAWQNSQTITDMTSNNAKVVIIDGVVHMVYGSRFITNDDNFRLFYTYAKIEDAYNDNWATPVLLDVGHWLSTATAPNDCGYPSLWKDNNNNLYAVYYDSDGTGSAYGANWRLCTGAPIEKAQAVYDGGSGSYNVAYSQRAVDGKIANLLSQINELRLAIGQLPDDPTDYDGTSPIYSGLVAWFDVTNTTKWDSYNASSMVGEATAISRASSSGSANGAATAPTVFDNGFANIGGLHFQSTISALVGDVSAFTIEFVNYGTTNVNIMAVLSTSAKTASNVIYSHNNNLGGYKKNKPFHFCAVFTSGNIDWYVNGEKVVADTTEVSFASILAGYVFTTASHNSAGSGLGDARLYNRALTADEIRNNYLYTQHETDYTTAPVFTTE